MSFSRDRWKDISQQRMGIVFSLPVMDDRVQRLCAEASRYQDAALVSLFGGHLPSDGLAIVRNSLISELKARVMQAAPSLFCMPMTSGANNAGDMMRDAMREQVKSRCKQAEDEFRNKPDAERKKSKFYSEPSLFGSDVDPLSGFDRKKCRDETEKDQREREREAYTKQEEARKALDTIMKCVKPAKVWEMARNGNLFMQSFSWGIRPKPRTAMLVPIGSRVPAGVRVPVDFIRAQAEMYFDCSGPWLGACDGNAMWEPKWKARLRRIAPLDRMAGDAAALIVGSGISHGLARFLGDAAFKKIPVVGTDIKYGNALNDGRDWLQEALYKNNPLASTQDGVTIIH